MQQVLFPGLRNPHSHWKIGKRILRYVAGMINYGLWYTTSQDHLLTRYIENDFVGNIDDRKNISGHVFHLGSNLISWAFKKQSIVSISSAETKYVVATSTSCHAIWLRRLLNNLAHMKKGPTHCDNNSTMALSINHVFYRKKQPY
jgi:hypothetical protein